MLKKSLVFVVTIILFGCFLKNTETVSAQTISDITLDPELQISYFDDYTITTNITPEPASATLTLQGLNGNDGSGDDWNFCANGSGTGQTLSYAMDLFSGTTWRKTVIRPDQIYPTILFAPASATWGTTPSNMNVRRQNYQILHFTNPFTMEDDMNFWIEINAEPESTVNSADLLVYLVEKGKTSSFFQTDWRNNLTDIELVGTMDRNANFHHSHSGNSKHHLIRLSTNDDKTVGSRSLDISGDFWLILYNTSPNVNRGWKLKYQTSSTCTNTDGWYRGNQTGWTITNQTGFPDVHTHFARKTLHADGVRATVTVGSASEVKDFSFAALPNLAPNATDFTAPVRGVYSGTFNVTWDTATDPNEEVVDYNLYLLDSQNNQTTLIEGTALTSYSWNTKVPALTDGEYTLKGQACDVANLCTDFYSQTFSLNNAAASIKSLNLITMASNNSDSTKAITGDVITLTFVSSAAIATPTVAFYSGGYDISNSVTVSSSDNINWIASYIVSANDTRGQVTFTISATDLDLEYSEVTSGSYTTIGNSESTASSNSSSNSDDNLCFEQIPSGIPDLFQIDVNKTKATLYYAPINSPVTDYHISFSESSNKFEHGTFTNQGTSGGVLSYTVNHLKPNTTYYFKIRGQNGCMPGSYSQEMKVTISKNKASYYKYSSFIVKPLRNFLTKNTVSVIKEEKNLPSSIPSSPKNQSGKKRCFLWWCF